MSDVNTQISLGGNGDNNENEHVPPMEVPGREETPQPVPEKSVQA